MTPREVLALCREKGVAAVDFWLTSLVGRWQRVTLPVEQLDEGLFEQGLPADPALVARAPLPGDCRWLIVPQPETAFVDPTAVLPTLGLMCHLVEPITGEESPLDTRVVVQRAANHLAASGVADELLMEVSLEYYLAGKDGGSAAKPEPSASRRGAFEPPVLDGLGDVAEPPIDVVPRRETALERIASEIRGSVMQHLTRCGYPVVCQQAVVDNPAQSRLELAPTTLMRAADAVQLGKYFVRQEAQAKGLTATFMPCPFFAAPPSTLAIRLAAMRDERGLFAGSGHAGLSDAGLHAIGGLLRHTAALVGLTCPSVNSFHRLAKPLQVGYSTQPGAICRIPIGQTSRAWQAIESSLPDATCNPYLALAGILMAVIDGVQNKLNPGPPLDDRQASGADTIPTAPETKFPTDLASAIAALNAGSDFLLRGDVFSETLLSLWCHVKLAHEADMLRGRPHPIEWSMYHDC